MKPSRYSLKLSGFVLPQYVDTINRCEFSAAARIDHNWVFGYLNKSIPSINNHMKCLKEIYVINVARSQGKL